MAKGVKKIKCIEGLVSNGSVTRVAIAPDKYAWFKVDEWESGTTDKDKQKEITWIRQSSDRSTIIHQKLIGASQQYGFMLPKKLCGPYAYYIEASLSGQRDFKQVTGMQVRGYCPPLIKASKWCTSNDGVDVRKSKKFSYGETVYLNLDTEGLNGSKGLVVEVYNRCTFSDKKIFTYTNICVIDGEVNLALTNTAAWQGQISNIKDEEEFYIQIKDPSGIYIKDANDDIIHARFLRIKNQLVSNQIKTPTNLTPLKVGEQKPNEERYEPCKFENITITETQKKDGKMEQTKVVVFEKGKKLVMGKPIIEAIQKTVFFDFDQAVLTPRAIETLKSTLNFLLGHEHSEVSLNGYACVIGPEDYNLGLSIRRSEAIKKYFTDGGLAANRIISYAKGEIQMHDGKITGGATDDKKGKDNKRYKDEKDYEEARRVDIMFNFYGHNAQTIVYETVAPSKDKTLLVDVSGLEIKKCFRADDKHEKKLVVTSPEYSEKEGKSKEGASMQIPVHSALSAWNAAPLQYIWPKWNLVNGMSGKGVDAATQYLLHVHSCRYFTDSKNATVLIKAYPDIKWELAVEFLVGVSNYKAANMPAGSIFKKHQEKAREAGYKRWLMEKQGKVPISIGVGLSAEWDEGREKRSYTQEFEKKIESIAKVISKATNILQDAINYAQGVAKQTEIPVAFDIRYPKFTVVGKWYLERIEERADVNIIGEVGFGFNPIIGAEVIIDIIGAAITAASYGTTGNPAAAKIINKFRGSMEKLGAKVNFTATFYGELSIMVDGLKIDAVNGIKMQGKSVIGGKMGATIELSMAAELGKASGAKFIPIDASFKAAAKADSYFGGECIIDSDKKGMFVQPILKFSGVMMTAEISGEVGWWKSSFKVEAKVIEESSLYLEKKYFT